MVFAYLLKTHKIHLNKKTLRKKRPSMFPKSGVPMEAESHFRGFLSGSPVKEPSLEIINCLIFAMGLQALEG
jgi:hypothetical protein